jgi:UDP-glucose 4-epimerase
MPERAIVTGGAGFIGSHVVDALLARGDRVSVVDDLSSGERRRVGAEAELYELDIVELERLRALAREVRPQAIYHLAAQASVVASVEDPLRDCDVNVKGTLNVLQVAREHGAPVVFTSTGGALYGDAAPRPTDENQIPAPLSPYGASKWAAEAYVKSWTLSGGVPNVALRLGNVYGPRQSPHGEAGVVAIFTHHLYTGRAPKVYGHGKPTRDYVYVSDVVEAVVGAKGSAGTFNIATGVETDVATIWRELAEAAGSSTQPQLEDLRPGELQHSCLDSTLARRELGWEPRTLIRDGLQETYRALVEEFEA